jgi:hypothetical protein
MRDVTDQGGHRFLGETPPSGEAVPVKVVGGPGQGYIGLAVSAVIGAAAAYFAPRVLDRIFEPSENVEFDVED